METWKGSKTLMIPTTGKPIANLQRNIPRPNALTNVGYKIFMGLVKSKLIKHLERNGVISDYQLGFALGQPRQVWKKYPLPFARISNSVTHLKSYTNTAIEDIFCVTLLAGSWYRRTERQCHCTECRCLCMNASSTYIVASNDQWLRF